MKEFWDTAEEDLSQLEKSIGSAVSKARSYYDARIKQRDTKETLMKAKHRFERAQALHVAAKELAVVSVNELPFKSLPHRYLQADYIDEAEKSNQNSTTWNETYEHAIAKVCAKNVGEKSVAMMIVV